MWSVRMVMMHPHRYGCVGLNGALLCCLCLCHGAPHAENGLVRPAGVCCFRQFWCLTVRANGGLGTSKTAAGNQGASTGAWHGPKVVHRRQRVDPHRTMTSSWSNGAFLLPNGVA